MKQIFRTLTYFVAALVAVATINSCAKEKEYLEEGNALDPGVERNINTSAGLPQNNDKAFLDGYKVKWNEGDKLNINGVSLTAATIENNVDNPRATFYGTVYAKQDASNNNDVYWAVYPSTLADAYSDGIPAEFAVSTFTYTLPAVQADTIGLTRRSMQNRTYMAGRTSVPNGTEHLSFQMRNLGAVMKIHFTAAAGESNTHASKIVFTSTSNNLSGTFSIDANDNISEITGTGKLTVNLSDGTHNYIDIANGGADVYVIIPPIPSNGGFTMQLYNSEDSYMEKTLSNQELKRNHIYTNSINDVTFPNTAHYYSTSTTTKVLFSPGNLQWSATNGGTTLTTHLVAGNSTDAGTFRFSENPWDFVGGVKNSSQNGNVYGAGGNSSTRCNNSQISASYNGWIDLFGWGTSGWNSGATAYYPYAYDGSETQPRSYYYFPGGSASNDLTGDYVYADWGVYNEIYNPATLRTDPAGTWRMLSSAEWAYVLKERPVASGIRYAKATLNGVYGIILVPDDWSTSTYTLNTGTTYNSNVISSTVWENVFEEAGCVFLPAAENRMGTHMRYAGTDASQMCGYYWSSTAYNDNYALDMSFSNSFLKATPVTDGNYGDRYAGRSVRLVKNYTGS